MSRDHQVYFHFHFHVDVVTSAFLLFSVPLFVPCPLMQIEGAEEYRISSTPSIDTVPYGNLVHTGTCIREMLIWLKVHFVKVVQIFNFEISEVLLRS